MSDVFFNVHLNGEYFIKSGDNNLLRPYDIKLKIPTWDNALSMCRYHILPIMFAKKDPDFKEIRRCIVMGITTAEGKSVRGLPISLQSKEQLAELVETQNIGLDVEMYPDIVGLRTRVNYARSNPEKFEQQESRKRKSFSGVHKAIELNAGIFDEVVLPAADISIPAEDAESPPDTEQAQVTEAKSEPQDTTVPAESSAQDGGEDDADLTMFE